MADSPAKQDVLIGVDIGGTKILAGVFTQQLKLLGTNKMTTKAARGYDAVVERIARCVRDAVDEADLSLKQVKGVGIGAPGAINAATGEVVFAPNLKWRQAPLKADLEKYLGVPVWIENDCNACALGVHAVEFEGKPRHLIGIFLGTGGRRGTDPERLPVRRASRDRRGDRPHGAAGRRGQVRMRQPRLLRGPRQPVRHLPPAAPGGEGRPEDHPQRR